ncbi:CpsD/CapB family tyrosine-protein kinase [Desulfolutivibrio sulfoxidireducens]|uniref:CpsD/CapB family tyrosine-protein kinase n=1 Tax=Desulfolutivibrio sulfoxidireducens TaxID=2773299 RepID=UPI00159DD14A|nr:CpsD/CapB family tyrosine-protein kinase [Desulfolutivibrio sulfoxidireducens]QLA14836.1 hypothetical protein GD605_01090 [Desulfolutivibrio sulfoxidireducens]
MARTTIRERFFAPCILPFVALAWTLCLGAGAARAAPVWHVVEEGCYARQQDALAAFDRLGLAVAGDSAAFLRVERLDAWFCLRLGAERTETGAREMVRDNRQALRTAVVIEAMALPERVVAGMAPGMVRPVTAAAQPASRTVEAAPVTGPAPAAVPAPLAVTTEPGPGESPAGPFPQNDPAEVVEISLAGPDALKAASPVPVVTEAPAQAAETGLAPGPAHLVPRAPDLPVVPAVLAVPETTVPDVLLAAVQDSPAAGQAKGGQDASADPAAGGLADRYAGMLWLGAKLAAVVLVLGLGAVIWRRRRAVHAAPAAVTGNGTAGDDRFAEPGGLPRLSEADERRLQENLDELAMVQSNILSSQNGNTIKSIYVTSCSNEEGKTTAAINMAHGLSINKNRVLLVDGNPRAPMLHKRYHVELSPGLAGWLAGYDGAREGLVRSTFYPHLSLVTFGASTLGRPNLLVENSLSRFLREYADDFDYIIMDGHSMTGSDTGMVASIFDAVVIVAQCEKTKWEVVKQAAQKMTLMGGKVLGVVLNRRKYYVPDFIYKAV